MNADDIQTMADAYICAALFTSDFAPEKNGMFDAGPLLPKVPQRMKAQALAICRTFYHMNAADLAGYPPSSCGHDLWCTRNGHGCGFWEADHCTKPEGERLTASCKRLGEQNVVRGAGGWIYFEGGTEFVLWGKSPNHPNRIKLIGGDIVDCLSEQRFRERIKAGWKTAIWIASLEPIL